MKKFLRGLLAGLALCAGISAAQSQTAYNAVATAYVTTNITQTVVFDSTMQAGGTFEFSVLAHNGGGRAGQSDTANVKIQFYNASNTLLSTVNTNYSANLLQPTQSGSVNTQGTTLSGNPQADPAVAWTTLSISSTNCGSSCATVAYAKVTMYGVDGSFWAGDYGPWYRAPTFTLNGGGNLLYNPEFGPYNGTNAQGWSISPALGACQGAWGGSNACIVDNNGTPGQNTVGLVANANGGGPSATGGTASGTAGGYSNTMSVSNPGPGTTGGAPTPPAPSGPVAVTNAFGTTATNPSGTTTLGVTNAGTYTNNGTNGAVTNTGTFTNNSITGAVTNSGTFTNTGTVTTVNNSATFDNSGIAGDVTNNANGTFTNTGTTGVVTNDGTFTNTGTTGAVTNSGTLTIDLTGTTTILTNTGTATNNGTITGTVTNTSGTFTNTGTTGDWLNNDTIVNSGTMANGTNNGTFTNNGAVGDVVNTGAFANNGTLTSINNSGTFATNSVTLSTYTQSSTGSTVTNYGQQITVTGTANLGGNLTILNGPTAYGKYPAFLTANSITGQYDSYTGPGVLKYTSTDVGFWIMPDGTVIQATVNSLANSMSNMNTLASGVINGAVGNDCATFGTSGGCISVNYGRTRAASGDLNSAGITVAKAINSNWRAGVYLSNQLNKPTVGGITYEGNNPSTGGFIGWNKNADGKGLGITISASQGRGDYIIGSDKTDVNGKAYQIKGTYTVAVNDVLITPYLGVRKTSFNVNGYTESGSEFPLTYSAINQTTTDALAGVSLGKKLTDKLSGSFSLGVVRNISYTAGSVTATSDMGNYTAPLQGSKYTSTSAGVGLSYEVVKNQRVGINFGWQQKSLTNNNINSYGLSYTIGF